MLTVQEKIEKLQGPILVLGASGFIGANIFRQIIKYRRDISGTITGWPKWRIETHNGPHMYCGNILDDEFKESVYETSNAKTVFDCLAYGSYPFQNDRRRIFGTNVFHKLKMIDCLKSNGMTCYIHAGSSSEYGTNSAGPDEDDGYELNSMYAKSKRTFSNVLANYYRNMRCANLRLYSVYGPYEDGSRLIPQVIQHGIRGEYPPFVRPDITRDFVYVDDVVEAFIDAANNLQPEDYGGSFNIGRGVATDIATVALLSQSTFGILNHPEFSMPKRDWDHANKWYADPTKANKQLCWFAKTTLSEGFAKTIEWWKAQYIKNMPFDPYKPQWQWPTLAPKETTQEKRTT